MKNPMMESVELVEGIGESIASRLGEIGVADVQDLLFVPFSTGREV